MRRGTGRSAAITASALVIVLGVLAGVGVASAGSIFRVEQIKYVGGSWRYPAGKGRVLIYGVSASITSTSAGSTTGQAEVTKDVCRSGPVGALQCHPDVGSRGTYRIQPDDLVIDPTFREATLVVRAHGAVIARLTWQATASPTVTGPGSPEVLEVSRGADASGVVLGRRVPAHSEDRSQTNFGEKTYTYTSSPGGVDHKVP